MSTTSEYRQLTPKQLDKLLRNPDNIDGFLEAYDADDEFVAVVDDDEDDDGFGDDEPAAGPKDDEEEEGEEDEDDFTPVHDDDAVGKYLSLDKSWHALHFLLNGTAGEGSGPLNDAFEGGTEIGEDAGSGPARILTPDEVRAVATALSKVNRADLKAKYNPKAFKDAKIHGFQDDFPGLVHYLKELTSFFEEAAANGNAVLMTVT